MSGCDLPAPDPRPHHGAFLFHQWAASQLPRNVRDAYGHRFVRAANCLLTDDIVVLSVLAERLETHDATWRAARMVYGEHRAEIDTPIKRRLRLANVPKVKPDVELACPVCPCETECAMADCLMARFHRTFESIDAESIAAWYSTLDGPESRDVRAFFRTVAQSDPMIRDALGAVLSAELSRQEGLKVTVTIEGESARPSESLRDAFAFTAMAAVHKWLGFPIVSRVGKKDCASFMVGKFGIEDANTIRNRWNLVGREVRESIKLHDSVLR